MDDGVTHVTIITPVYNDWEALGHLLTAIEAEFPADAYTIAVVAVDDCSTLPPQPLRLSGCIRTVDVIRLTMNVGHQRAIAVGLVHVDGDGGSSLVAVMDSDGEDRPVELRRLVDRAVADPHRSIVAFRKKRSESLAFKFFYRIYRNVFAALTGHRLNFGNFSVLPRAHVGVLVHNANIWNNFAATLIQSKMPLTRVSTERGRRYAGRSTMNFVNLVTHGLGAISVFSDAVFVRILLLSIFVFVGCVAAVLGVLSIKLLTPLAVPGWTTTVIGFALVLSIQAMMMPIMVAFLQLNNRSSFQSMPKSYASQLIESIKRIHAGWLAPTPEKSITA